MKSLHVGMGEGFVNRDSLFWVKHEHLLNKVHCVPVLVALEHVVEVLTLLRWQAFHELPVVRVVDLLDEVVVWLANQIGDHHHLLLLILRG